MYVNEMEVRVERYLTSRDGPDRNGEFRTSHMLWKAYFDLEDAVPSPIGYGETSWEAVGNLLRGMAVLGQLERCFGQ